MLNYSNTHRKDPKVKSNAFKCAITLALVFFTCFILFTYDKAILAGLDVFFTGAGHLIANAFMGTVSFLKPMFDSIGIYLLWACVFIWLWSLCVFTKVKADCLESNKQWQKIGHLTSVILIVYCIFYSVSLGEKIGNSDGAFAATFIFLGIFSNVYLILISISRKEEDEARSQSHN